MSDNTFKVYWAKLYQTALISINMGKAIIKDQAINHNDVTRQLKTLILCLLVWAVADDILYDFVEL